MNAEQYIEEIQKDMEMEGLSNYEAFHHSDLHLDEISQMTGEDASILFLDMLEKNKYMDGWIASVLDALSENKDQYNLSEDWFEKILKHESLRIF